MQQEKMKERQNNHAELEFQTLNVDFNQYETLLSSILIYNISSKYVKYLALLEEIYFRFPYISIAFNLL